jgi:hypothetical protein
MGLMLKIKEDEREKEKREQLFYALKCFSKG